MDAEWGGEVLSLNQLSEPTEVSEVSGEARGSRGSANIRSLPTFFEGFPNEIKSFMGITLKWSI